MIDFLEGVIISKTPTKLVMAVNGVGYAVNITISCYERLGEIGDRARVLTYLHVREDILQLYGFSSMDERELFLQLIATPGIGPRKAQAILSSISVEHLQQYIFEENLEALTSLSGVGKKTAQRLILDLKDKVAPARALAPDQRRSAFAGDEQGGKIDQAIAALLSLGFTKNQAQLAVQKAMMESPAEITLEDLIKRALRLI